VTAAVGSCVLWARAELLFRRASFPPEQDLLYLPRAQVMRVASLGHMELFADLVWIRAVVYAGGEIAQRGDMKWLDHYLDTILELDPTFRRPYIWAGVITMYNGRLMTNDMVRRSNHYLELGEARFPKDWELPFMLGSNYLHELKTDDPKQKAAWRRIAGEHIRHAAIVGGGPDWLPLLAASIYSKEGENELAVRHLEEVYASSEDAKVREQVRLRLLALRKESESARVSQLERARGALEQGWRAWAPYTPLDLFVLVGETPTDRTLTHLVDDPLLSLPEGAP
jgi:hypothetical protein